MVPLEYHGFVWLQEERQVVNSRRGEGHFRDGEGPGQRLSTEV